MFLRLNSSEVGSSGQPPNFHPLGSSGSVGGAGWPAWNIKKFHQNSSSGARRFFTREKSHSSRRNTQKHSNRNWATAQGTPSRKAGVQSQQQTCIVSTIRIGTFGHRRQRLCSSRTYARGTHSVGVRLLFTRAKKNESSKIDTQTHRSRNWQHTS